MLDDAVDSSRAEVLAERIAYVIVTALPKEYATVQKMLLEPQEFHAPDRGAGSVYALGEVPAKSGGTPASARRCAARLTLPCVGFLFCTTRLSTQPRRRRP